MPTPNTLTVGDLRKALAGVPDDVPVILQSDSEYRWAHSAAHNGLVVYDEGAWADIYYEEWGADEADMTDSDWEELLEQPRVFVIDPVN